jgi:peptidoglycan/xylan/chitin deacetylase (PgdA/CDA1 family)
VPPARVGLIVVVATCYGVLLGAALGKVPPFWVSVALLSVLAIAVNVSIFFINLGVFHDVVSKVESGGKSVALTFDDGPHPVHTRKVLDILDQAGAKGTFFVIGDKAQAHPDVIAEIVRRGHEVGLHSFSHDHLLFMRPQSAIAKDIVRTQDAVEKASGVRPMLFRPPVGFSSPRTRVAVREAGVTVVGWSARAFDGAGRPTIDQIVRRIDPSLSDGAIVLLHDAAERGDAAPTSIDALPALLERLQARGLRAVTVSTLTGGAAPSGVVAQAAR